MTRNSIASNWRPEPRVVIALAALLAVLYYLIVSQLIFEIGFPLDDTWIHLTYARNLAEHGEWAFRPGDRSAGSTAPLWTGLLAIGFLVKLAPYVWTYLLGWVILTLFGIQAENVARKLVTAYRPRVPWVGLFFVIEWHLTWSAVSGMETLLHGLIVFIVLAALMTGSRRYLTLGLLAGLSIWIRPDGLTLIGPIAFTIVLSESTWSARGQALFNMLIGFGALFFPYLLFNLALSGNPMPNTFYAKQAEYEVYWLSKSLGERISSYLWQFIASPFFILIPGMVLWLITSVRKRQWGVLAGAIWFFGYVLIYFMRLPPYQHGRYIIPALPIMYLWGILGLLQFIDSDKGGTRLKMIWQALVVVLCIAFGFIGARQNAYDVYWIESEMIATAKWVRQNTSPDASLAVHDIGALGYFAENPIVDMAGLITPEVVPFIRDEARLAKYLDSSEAEYLIVFPHTYPQLTSNLTPVFTAGLDFDPLQLDEDMQVYRWK